MASTRRRVEDARSLFPACGYTTAGPRGLGRWRVSSKGCRVIGATYWPALRSAEGRRFTTSWAALVRKLSSPRVVAVKHDVPGLSLATFRGNRRALANVEQVFAIGLDFDKGLDWPALCLAFADTAAFIHTTWQSTPEAPRAR